MSRFYESRCTRNGQTGWVTDCGRGSNSIFARFWTLCFFSLSSYARSLSRFYFVLERNFRGNWERVLLCPARLRRGQGEQQSGQGPVLIETARSPNSVDHRPRSPYPMMPLIPSCTTRQVLGKKTSFGELAMQCKCKRSATVGAGVTVISNETFETGLKSKLNHSGPGRRRRHETPCHTQETVSAPTTFV